MRERAGKEEREDGARGECRGVCGVSTRKTGEGVRQLEFRQRSAGNPMKICMLNVT